MITLTQSQLLATQHKLVPGMKLCVMCNFKINELVLGLKAGAQCCNPFNLHLKSHLG